MPLRRLAPAALVLWAVACQESLPGSTNPAYVDYAIFDPTTGAIPLPNDLALATAAFVPGAQGQFLQSLATNGCTAGQQFPACGGFPNDTSVPITAGFERVPLSGGAPGVVPLDVVSSGAVRFCNGSADPTCNIAVLRVDTSTPEPQDATTVDVSYVGGTLVLSNKNPAPGAPWPSGARYVVALRAGQNGLRTTDGGWVNPSPIMWLLLQDVDLSLPENQSLLPGATPEERAAAGAQLEALRQIYATPQGGAPLSVFGLVDSQFPHREIAVLTTFNIVSGTYVVVDPAAGVVPLPSDFLLDPTTGKVAYLPDAFGPLAAGIATLDGFSTTGMIMAPTSGPIAAASVGVTDPANQSVFLYKMTLGGPVLVYDLVAGLTGGGAPTYVAQPPPLVDPVTGTSLLIGLQPAVPVETPLGILALPPLEEATTYAVVVTRRVQDCPGSPPSCTGGHDLIRNSAADLLTISTPIYSGGHSTVAGVSDALAQALEPMRAALQPVYAALPAPLTTQSVAMAYTFRTQSITNAALMLGAAPYQQSGGVDVFPDAPVPAYTTVLTPTQAAQKYGVPTSTGLLTGVDHFVDTVIVTFDELDPATGAFYANPADGVPTPIPALVAIPAGTPPAGGWPLVVFHHGLGRGRADMMLIAGALAQAGLASAAIDAPKHGDRSWCRIDADCASGATCNHSVFGNQGDVACPPGSPAGCTPPDFLPGLCTVPGLAHAPLMALPACTTPPTGDCWDGTGGIAVSSAAFLISGNFFRWRDSVRQDVLDQSMLVRVLTTANGQAVLGAAVDPTKVYYVGQSLGSIEGTLDLAANPRFSRAVLNVGGGTWVDIGTTSPTFQPLLAALLAGAGIDPVTNPAGYLQFLYVSKWVLDPADPLNFARHLVADPLPNLLFGGTPQPAKIVLGQAARCDDVVPNSTNQELYGLVGLAPLDPFASSTAAGLQWFMADTTTACPLDGSTGAGGATHGFLLDFANPSLTIKAQASAAGFLLGASPSTPVTP